MLYYLTLLSRSRLYRTARVPSVMVVCLANFAPLHICITQLVKQILIPCILSLCLKVAKSIAVDITYSLGDYLR